MKLNIKQKIVLTLTAVIVLSLPFWGQTKEKISIYTVSTILTDKEKYFAAALEKQGFTVELNPIRQSGDTALWFILPEEVKMAEISVEYNFLYTKAHYPVIWINLKNPPILLTPHRDLYEHYTRSNLKTALFNLENRKEIENSAKRFKEILSYLKSLKTIPKNAQ